MKPSEEVSGRQEPASAGAHPSLRARGVEAMRVSVPRAFTDSDDIDFRDGSFGDELFEIGLESVWGALWSRPGLSPRDRSLVTLGILIALGAREELRAHLGIARTNGLSIDELAEVVYHSSGYAGFPAAKAAREIALDVLAPSSD